MRSTRTGIAATPSGVNALVVSSHTHCNSLVINSPFLSEVHDILISMTTARIDADPEGKFTIRGFFRGQDGQLSNCFGRDYQ